MGEMEVFHVRRMQKAKEAKKSAIPKFCSNLYGYLFSNHFLCDLKADEQQKHHIRIGPDISQNN